MKFNRKYNYPKSMRSLIDGKRHYDIGNDKLPSVTTILSATQSDEKKKSLADWRARMGAQSADRIRDVSAMRGTAMHRYLEAYIDGTGHKDLTSIGKEAEPMAKKIIESGLGDLEEVWGQEVTLYYPGLYAGATDIVGVYEGKPAIIDFKQTNKPKKREWISDYFSQVAAYAMAHDYQFGTQINQCVIMICTKPPEVVYQDFVLEGNELKQAKYTFLRKVDTYYKSQKNFSENKKS